MDGKKAYIAGAALIVAGLWALVACIVPGLSDSPCNADAAVATLAQGLGVIGIRHAVAKGF